MHVAELQIWEAPRERFVCSVLVVALLTLNLADVLTTQLVLGRGGIELNPLSAWLIDNGMLVHAKMAVASFIAVAAAVMAATRRVSSVLAPVVAYYVIVVGSNTVQLLGIA